MASDPKQETDRPLHDVIVVVFPEDGDVARVDVAPGDIVVLPFDSDVPLMMKEGSGNLGIKADRDHDHTVVLKGYADAMNDPQHSIVVESRDGTPIDVALVLAETSYVLDGECACDAMPTQQTHAGGGIYQPFEGSAPLGGFDAVGRQDFAGVLGLGGLPAELLQ